MGGGIWYEEFSREVRDVKAKVREDDEYEVSDWK
jgi:hypothetical protein